MQEQPFRLLSLLVERPGEVVTSEDLREKLWPADTYVDFDRSLNKAAGKLKEALGDAVFTIVVRAGTPSKLYEITSEGGELRPLLADSQSESLGAPRGPHFLPLADGRRVLLFNAGRDGHLVILDIYSGQERTLTHGEEQMITFPKYSPSGHLLYRKGGVLWALPFSRETLDSTGEAFPVDLNHAVNLSVSGNGTLVYKDWRDFMDRLVWCDRKGNELGTVGQPQAQILYPALSPDETRIAVAGAGDEGADIWIHDTQREMKTRSPFIRH